MSRIAVTGANRGIGFEITRQAFERGMEVVALARGNGNCSELEDRLPGINVLNADVTDRTALGEAAAKLNEPLDILINNAGIIGPERQSTLDMDFDGFARTLAVNTLAPLAVAQAFLPALRNSANGRILTLSSQMAWMGYAISDRIAYRASKAAVNKVMQGLATDLAPENIAVALVDPGWVRTDMGGDEADLDSAEVASGILDLATGLSMADTGRFYKWTGEERQF